MLLELKATKSALYLYKALSLTFAQNFCVNKRCRNKGIHEKMQSPHACVEIDAHVTNGLKEDIHRAVDHIIFGPLTNE